MYTFTAVCLVVLVGLSAGDSTFSETCRLIEDLDCETFTEHVICGTDGVSYSTRCHFSKAHCANPDLHYLHLGICDSTVSTTIQSVVNTTHKTHEVIEETFCKAMAAVTCLDDGGSVCASNGISYKSQCHFERARCLDKTLVIVDAHHCVRSLH